mgnify:CR=1 FL=1
MTLTRARSPPRLLQVVTYAQVTNVVLARGWLRKLVDQAPAVVFSLMLGGLGGVLALRRRRG